MKLTRSLIACLLFAIYLTVNKSDSYKVKAKQYRAANVFSRKELANILNIEKVANSSQILIKYQNGTVITDEILARVKKSSQAPPLRKKLPSKLLPHPYFMLNSHRNEIESTNITNPTKNPHEITACFPSQGNLLIGRSRHLFASSTCGLTRPDTFCVLGGNNPSHAKQRLARRSDKLHVPQEHMPILVVNNVVKKSSCEICDSREPFDFVNNDKSHRVDNVIKYNEVNRTVADQKWWQSENDMDIVHIRLDLEAEFILTRVFIKFKNYPPQVMTLEKSTDYGRTWQTLAYYASDCALSFPAVSTRLADLFHMPICISRYSNFESRELVYRPLMYGRISQDPYMLAKHSKFTNLRINLRQLLKLGDNLLADNDFDRSYLSQYYYAISEIQVMGFCSCNGHASKCTPVSGANGDPEGLDFMVHGKCECIHNTQGLNCERCLPLYNDLPWRASEHGWLHECKRCECHEHAESCHFDQLIYQQSGWVSGGVCDNCAHNTHGLKCEMCKPNFYHDRSLSFTNPLACKRNKS